MRPPDPGPTRRRVAIGAAGAAVLIGSIDAYVLVSVLVDMIGEFDIPVNHLERATPLVTGYLLGYTAGMPLLGRLSDRFGRKPVIHACLAAFAVGSVISATATELVPLVAGRALQGLAGGALLPVTMALAADLFAARRRPAVLGWVGAAQELGAVLGPLFGASVAALVGWRGIFWINLPLALLAALAIHFALPSTRPRRDARSAGAQGESPASRSGQRGVDAQGEPPPNAPTRRDTARVDFVGGALLALALGLFTVGLYNPDPAASVLPPWGLPTVIAGVVALLIFGLQQWRSPVRLLEPAGVRWRPFAAGLVASLAAGAVLMVTLVDVQLLAQTLLDLDSAGGALLLLWFLIGLPLGALFGGFLASRFGERLPAVVGFAAAAAAYFWIGRSIPDIEPGLALAGAALGITIAPLSSAALRTTPEDRHGTAAALVVVARMMGMLVGVAALTSWSLHRFQSATADLDTPLPFGVPEAEFLALRTEYLAALDAALANQYAEVFTAAACICLAAALVAVALPGSARSRATARPKTPHPDSRRTARPTALFPDVCGPALARSTTPNLDSVGGMADLSVVENVDEHRYELLDDAGTVLGYLEYLTREDFIVLPHTEVDRSLRGQGWGDRLVRHVLDELRKKDAKVYPTCPFVDRWMQKHDEYEDLRYQA